MPPEMTRRRSPGKEKKSKNILHVEEDGSFEITIQQNARRVYLWVILIFLPLPLAVIASLVFGVLLKMAWFFQVLATIQTAGSIMLVISLRPVLTYQFRKETGLIYYRTEVMRVRREHPFANVKNIRTLFVASQIIGNSRKYLLFRLKGIYANGQILDLSGFETGSSENLNRIGEVVANSLEIPFTPAMDNRISRIIKQLGPKIEYRVENVKIK